MDKQKNIFHRTSIRKYQDKAIEPEAVELLLRAAMAAPSACNQQPWEFYVVTDEDVKERLSQCTPYVGFTKNAPLALVLCKRTEGLQSPQSTDQDMGAATENILLQADELGIGTCWQGISAFPEWKQAVKDVLEVPDRLDPFCMISCGYPAEEREQEDRYDESRVHYI